MQTAGLPPLVGFDRTSKPVTIPAPSAGAPRGMMQGGGAGAAPADPARSSSSNPNAPPVSAEHGMLELSTRLSGTHLDDDGGLRLSGLSGMSGDLDGFSFEESIVLATAGDDDADPAGRESWIHHDETPARDSMGDPGERLSNAMAMQDVEMQRPMGSGSNFDTFCPDGDWLDCAAGSREDDKARATMKRAPLPSAQAAGLPSQGNRGRSATGKASASAAASRSSSSASGRRSLAAQSRYNTASSRTGYCGRRGGGHEGGAAAAAAAREEAKAKAEAKAEEVARAKKRKSSVVLNEARGFWGQCCGWGGERSDPHPTTIKTHRMKQAAELSGQLKRSKAKRGDDVSSPSTSRVNSPAPSVSPERTMSAPPPGVGPRGSSAPAGTTSSAVRMRAMTPTTGQ